MAAVLHFWPQPATRRHDPYRHATPNVPNRHRIRNCRIDRGAVIFAIYDENPPFSGKSCPPPFCFGPNPTPAAMYRLDIQPQYPQIDIKYDTAATPKDRARGGIRSDPMPFRWFRILCLFGTISDVCRFCTWRRAVCGGQKRRPGAEIIPEMADSIRKKQYLPTRGDP